MIMESAKRRIDGDDKSPFTLSFRFSKDLVSKINSSWKEEGFANRTALVEAACKFYFDTLECPRCKNRNHKNSLFCSICGNSLNPSYELKKNLKSMFDDFLEYQKKVISLEREVDEERGEYNKKITSAKLNPELKSSLEDILSSTAKEYWLGIVLQIMETDGLEEVHNSSIPSGYHEYASKWDCIQQFFQSSTYLKDTPHLTTEIADNVQNIIDDLIEFQIGYEIGLKRDLDLYVHVNKLIDKLTGN